MRPYEIRIDAKEVPWFVAFGAKIARIDRATMAITEFALPHSESRPRRIAISPDCVVWHTDYERGALSRINPKSGNVGEMRTKDDFIILRRELSAD